VWESRAALRSAPTGEQFGPRVLYVTPPEVGQTREFELVAWIGGGEQSTPTRRGVDDSLDTQTPTP